MTTNTTPESPATPAATPVTGERADLLVALEKQRHFLRFTTRDLTDEQAGLRTTASELCLGGLVKHVSSVERLWADFIVEGASAMPDFSAMTEADFARRADEFRMLPGETLAGVLAEYAEVARRTDELVATLPDLNATQALPKAPWFEADAEWSARRVLLHIVAETAQHAGHADIIREALDGAKSMG
ncbi:DinB family protein [Kitasatospora aureofaciens]|uniref:DinB family protein n=1 Tax=Kitasatospora aureofaciens TaxID=1894 RepID=UPI0036F483D7